MRQGELLALNWDNVNLEKRIAFLKITKNGDARAVPLSGRAIELLQSIPRADGNRVLLVQKQGLYSVFNLELASISGHKTLQMLKKYTHLQAEKLAAKMG